MKTAIVVDLETLGKGEAAHILTIGAVCVDLDSLTVVSEFYTAVSDKGQDSREVDEDTMEWWEKQAEESEQAYILALHRRRHAPSLSEALDDLAHWMIDVGDEFDHRAVFGNGPEFDNKILEHAYRQCGIKAPWKYSNNQSIRTMALIGKQFFGFDHYAMPFEGIKHHALYDAKHEAKVLIEVWRMQREFTQACSSILMSRDNPNGWKLEELLLKIKSEVHAKTEAIDGNTTKAASICRENNGKICRLLGEASKWQNDTLTALNGLGPDQGPKGEPRI